MKCSDAMQPHLWSIGLFWTSERYLFEWWLYYWNFNSISTFHLMKMF